MKLPLAPTNRPVPPGTEKLSLLIVSGRHNKFQITLHPDLRVVVDAPSGVASGKLIADKT